MLMLIESGILYVLYFVSFFCSLLRPLLKIYLQGAQVAMSISSVDYGMEQNTVLTFALTIGEYVSSLIVVHSLSDDLWLPLAYVLFHRRVSTRQLLLFLYTRSIPCSTRASTLSAPL